MRGEKIASTRERVEGGQSLYFKEIANEGFVSAVACVELPFFPLHVPYGRTSHGVGLRERKTTHGILSCMVSVKIELYSPDRGRPSVTDTWAFSCVVCARPHLMQ